MAKEKKSYAPQQLKGTRAVAPTPSADEMKAWEEKAGIKSLGRKEAFGSFQPAEPNDIRHVPGAKTPDLSDVAAGLPAMATNNGADADSKAKPRVRVASAPLTAPDNHLRPTLVLGKPKHREIYADVTAGTNASPEAREAKGQEWDTMPDEEKLAWQNGPGRTATKTAIDNHVKGEAAVRKELTRTRDKARELSFSNPDGYKKFAETGELPREGIIEDVPNPRDPAQRAALGEPRTQPESDWRKGWVGGATSRPELRMSLTSSPKHHADLAAHINDLQSRRLKGQGASLPLGVVGRDVVTNERTGHITAPHFNMEQIGGGFPTANGGSILRENQFDAKGLAARDAMESLTKSARAHSLGLKDQALQHFAAAVGHTKRLATIVNDNNRTRGANVPDFPEADLDKANDIHDDYKDSLGQ